MPLSAYRALSPPAKVGVALFAFSIVVIAIAWTATRITFEIQRDTLLLLLTTVTGFAVSAWREARNRRWAKKDQEDKLKEQTAEIIARAQAEATALLIQTEAKARALHFQTLATAERIRQETLVSAQAIRQDQRQATETLAVAIADVHAVAAEAAVASKEAAHEANNANLKIADFQERLLSAEEVNKAKEVKADETIGKLDAIQSTADAIDGKVDSLKKP
jgi:hypothetical protein